VRELTPALLVLDPLMSRIGSDLDTHKDQEVRQGLEPLVALANETGMAIIGIIHHNKSGATDPLLAVIGSIGFVAVARSVSTIVRDADDPNIRYFATPKNNLGPSDLPVRSFTIESVEFPHADKPITTSRLIWGLDTPETIEGLMERANDKGNRTAIQECCDWLEDFMITQGGKAASGDAKSAGQFSTRP